MLYTVGGNTACTYSNIPNVFSVGFLVYSVAHSVYHKQCSFLSYQHQQHPWTETIEQTQILALFLRASTSSTE